MGIVAGVTSIIGTILAILTFYFSTYLPYISGENTPATEVFTPVLRAIPGAQDQHERNDSTPEPDSLTAEIIPSDTQGVVPATFQFRADVEGGTEPYTYSWNFDDGSSEESNEQSVSHTFEDVRSYNVVLTVRDSGDQTASNSIEITVTEPEPEPEPEPEEEEGQLREEPPANDTG